MKATHLNKNRIPESQLILNADGSVYHLGLRGEDIADTVIIVGDPDRVPKISVRFDTVRFRKSGREFVIHTGSLRGREITVVSSGIGVDNIDIVLNELDAAVNIDPVTRQPRENLRHLNIVRIGTCGALREDIPVGTFIASAFAFGYDGLPYHYSCAFDSEEQKLAAAFQTHCNWDQRLAQVYCVRAGSQLLQTVGADMVHGITVTANGFYGPQNRSLRLPLFDPERMEKVRTFEHEGMRTVNFEMECSGIYALSGALEHQALTTCVVLANRYLEAFSSDPEMEVNKLIDKVLSRL